MARFHGKVLGLARLAAILACIGSVTPGHAAADPLSTPGGKAFGIHTSAAFPDEGSRVLPEVPARYFQKNDWPFVDFFNRAVRQSYVRAYADQVGVIPPASDPAEACFAGDHPLLDKARKASILILTTYKNGSWTQGTATIVKGSGAGGPDLILTAAHVVESQSTKEGDKAIEAIHAYDAEGLYLGSLDIVLRGDHDVTRQHKAFSRQEGLPISIANDLAVLRVEKFSSPQVENGWGQRGLGISPIQSGFVQFLSQRADGWAFNPGASGGAILDDQGRIIGVGVYYGWSGGKAWDTPETGMLDRLIKAEGDPDHFGDFFSRLKEHKEASGEKMIRYGTSMIALPVRQAELREALGLPELPEGGSPSTQLGLLAAYPDQGCAVSQVRSHDVLAWPAQARFEADRLYWDAPPDIIVASQIAETSPEMR